MAWVFIKNSSSINKPTLARGGVDRDQFSNPGNSLLSTTITEARLEDIFLLIRELPARPFAFNYWMT